MVGLVITTGFIILICGIILAIWSINKLLARNENAKNAFKHEHVVWSRSSDRENTKEPVLEVEALTPKLVLPSVLIVVALGIFVLSSAILNTRDGFKYRIISPDGSKTAISIPGYHIINPWAKVQEWNKYIDIRTIPTWKEGEEGVTEENIGKLKESPEGIEGVIRGGIPIRFTDQVVGETYVSVRVQLPEDDESFLKIAEVFRHPENLTNNTLLPTIKEQVINTTYMFTAEGYVNSEAGEYRQTIDDAIKNGGFKMVKVENMDTVYAEDFSTAAVNRIRTIKEIKKTFKTEKVLDDNGIPIRYEHDITKLNLIISQVIVEQVDLEEKFQVKLEQQRDISASKSIEFDMIAKAQISQQRIIAEGERDKASERVEKEKAQVGTLISIETEVKKEESKRQLAEIAVETAKLNAEKVKIDANAKAYEIKQADGLSAEAKYLIDADVERSIGVAKAIAGPQGITLPTTTISTAGNGKGESDLTTLLLLQMLNQNKTK